MLSLWFSMALLAANPTHSSTITLDLSYADGGGLNLGVRGESIGRGGRLGAR